MFTGYAHCAVHRLAVTPFTRCKPAPDTTELAVAAAERKLKNGPLGMSLMLAVSSVFSRCWNAFRPLEVLSYLTGGGEAPVADEMDVVNT
jgi:hypothetical protein